MFTQKAIQAKSFRPQKAKYSGVMKDLMRKGGDKLLKKSADRQEFWNAMRKEGMDHAFGDRGMTKTDVKKFFGKMMKNKSDRFSDKKIRALSKMFIPNGKSYTFSGISTSNTSHASQAPQPERRVVDMNKVVAEIRAKDITKRQPLLSDSRSSSPTALPTPARQSSPMISFAQSDSAMRQAEDQHLLGGQNQFQNYNKNMYGYVSKTSRNFNEHADISKVQSMLARIEGKADNYDEDTLKKAV